MLSSCSSSCRITTLLPISPLQSTVNASSRTVIASGHCRFNYPQPIVPTTYSDHAGRIHYRRRTEQDAWIVPYNIELLRKFKCHLNVEAANSSHLFQYIFKYIHKGIVRRCSYPKTDAQPNSTILGPDRAKFRIFTAHNNAEPIDEIQEYWDGRYLSAGEVTWRILGFHITRKDPGGTSLPVHLPQRSSHHRQYSWRSQHASQYLSLLECYFHRPAGTFSTPDNSERTLASLMYAEYFALFRLAKYDASNANHPGYFRRT